jgi:hypothetical protein
MAMSPWRVRLSDQFLPGQMPISALGNVIVPQRLQRLTRCMNAGEVPFAGDVMAVSPSEDTPALDDQ